MLSGQLTDETFDIPLAGALVKLYQVPVGTTQLVLLESQTTSSDGKFSFSFPRDKMEKYILKASKNLYFDLNESIYFSTLELEEENIRNFSTTAKSWARIILKNDNPSAADILSYIKQQGKVNCAECCPASQQMFNGDIDTVFYCINDGNTVYSFLYSIIGTGNASVKSATTIAFDTTDIQLNY